MREPMLILHFIGLAMGVGTSFGFMFLGIASKKMSPEESVKFRLNAFALSKMGHIGLAILIISGGALMTPYWKALGDMPLLMAKLGLVVVLAGFIGIISGKARRAKQSVDPGAELDKIQPLGQITMLVGLAIIICAVYVFH